MNAASVQKRSEYAWFNRSNIQIALDELLLVCLQNVWSFAAALYRMEIRNISKMETTDFGTVYRASDAMPRDGHTGVFKQVF